MKSGYTRLIVFILCSFLGLASIINCCGGDGDDEGNISSTFPSIDEIAGSYIREIALISASAQCYDSSSALIYKLYNNLKIDISTDGNNVTVHSVVPIKGAYNSSDGSYSGGAGLLAIVESMTGKFEKKGSTITLTGQQNYHQLFCDESYNVVYTKN
jgi:hypothetical protein